MITTIIRIPINIDCVGGTNSTSFHRFQCTDHRRTERAIVHTIVQQADLTAVRAIGRAIRCGIRVVEHPTRRRITSNMRTTYGYIANITCRPSNVKNFVTFYITLMFNVIVKCKWRPLALSIVKNNFHITKSSPR